MGLGITASWIMINLIIYVLYAIVFECPVVSAWSIYNGEVLEKQNVSLGWDAATAVCRSNHSIISSPLDPEVRDAIVLLVLDNSPVTAPEVTYWSGFKRNTLPNEWIGDHYLAFNTTFKWKSGYTGEEVGDCLAMEVMPFGITYYPADCAVTLQFICHKFQATYPTKQMSQTLLKPPVPFGEFDVQDEADCIRTCALDLNCNGYYYEPPWTCHTYNDASFSGGTISTPASPLSTETAFCPLECYILDCQCNETVCELNDCNLPGQAPNCTFTNCLNVSLCEAFSNSTCVLNGSNVFINCEGCLGIETTTESITITTPTPTPTNYSYTEINGCVSLYTQDYGFVYPGNSTFNSTRRMRCFGDYESPLSLNDTLVCDFDRRWSLVPVCIDGAPGCPPGWYEYRGSCYQVRDVPVTWFDQTCDVDNAFSLHIQTAKEADFIDKLLYYHQGGSFWTGGSNINVRLPELFYWNYNHDEMEYQNFEFGVNEFPESSCVSLLYTNASYYYQAEDCLTLKPFVCKKGRVLIGGNTCHYDSWCIGRGTCSNSGKCVCSDLKLYGAETDDPGAFCGNSKLVVQDSTLVTLAAKGWEYAIAECETEGGSLLTVLSKDWEEILQTNYGVSGYDIRFWSGYRFENGTFIHYGASYLNISDLSQIPWRNVIKSNWYNMEKCVTLRVSALGVRYDVANRCDYPAVFRSLCQLVDNRIFFDGNKKYTGSTPFREYYPVLADTACFLKCQYHRECLSFNYFLETKTCKLFAEKSPTASSDSPNVHEYRSGCRRPYNPVNGYLVGNVPDPAIIGDTLSFECDPGYAIPLAYSSTMTCLESGQWDNVPKCVVGGLTCPQGWEQTQTSCYNVKEIKRSYENAVTICNNMGGTLVEVYSTEEMDYIAKLVDHNRNGWYFTGANCLIMDGYYSWSSNPYSMITYTRWFNGPTTGVDCVVLRRMFSMGDSKWAQMNDTGTLYYASADCGTNYETSQPFICKMNLLNVGSMQCAQYGADPCKQNSECLDDKCVCRDSFYQLGDDDVDTTECLPIQPVGSSPCYGMDEFCLNNATCVNDVCTCTNGLYQNGQSKSRSTVCQEDFVSCPENWLQHDRHCYNLVSGFLASVEPFNDVDPAVHCGMHKAYMAVIPDMETNEVIASLGTSRSYRLIGLVDEFNADSYEWLATETSPIFTHFEFQNRTKIIGAVMNPLGYWVKVSYKKDPPSPDNPNPIIKDTMVCEKPHLCTSLTVISNAATPPSAIIGEHVGKEYLYTCDQGYIISGLGYPFIKCREYDYRVSSWDPTPQCLSLLSEKYIDVSATSLSGTYLQTYTNVDTNQICASYCYDLKPCEAFYFSATSGNCDLYDLQTTESSIPTDAEVWRTNKCDPIPVVKHATIIQATGRDFGDTITYRCASNYRIARNTSAVIRCLSTGRWDADPPVCIKRFSREPGAKYKIGTYGKNKMYFNIFTADDCEVKCIQETRFRCLFCVYRHGTCHLWNKLPFWYRDSASFEMHIDGSSSSSFEDADIDMFETTAEMMIVDGGGEAYNNVSYEICAQNCAYDLSNCTVFEYWKTTGYCRTFNVNPASLTTEAHAEFHIFTRKHICSDPPEVAGITFKPKIRQSQNVYYIGDIVTATCDMFGEELVAGHSGDIECLASGYWSPRKPACKNLCELGWYMFNYTCYKLEEIQMTFWDAFDYCHSLDAGLINVYTVDEYQFLLDIWNYTTSPVSDLWIGLYTDFNSWHWTERLGGNIDILQSASSNMAMVLTMANLSMSAYEIGIVHPFACEKAAPKLRCPDGWAQYKDKCYQAQATTATFQDAVSGCNGLNAELATVSSYVENDIIGQLANETGEAFSFIGLERPAMGHYKWSDGSVPKYLYMITQESDFINPKCGVILMEDAFGPVLKLSLDTCDTARPYVCQKFIDQDGVADDYTNLPCSTDGFCRHSDFACLGGIDGEQVYPPSCSGKECPPPWKLINNKCLLVESNLTKSYYGAAHYCWNRNGNLARMESFVEVYNIVNLLPDKKSFYVGYYAYESNNLFDIKTKRRARFPIYTLGSTGGAILDYENVGKFTINHGSFILNFICEKDPVFVITNSAQYEGCFGETTIAADMDLPYEIITDSTAMTIEVCINHCSLKGYLLAGIMNGDNCGCGNNRGNYFQKNEGTFCNITCTGDTSQICGGLAARSVYRTTDKKCISGMPRNPLDPRVCYTYNTGLRVYSNNRLDCIHQGGYTIMPKTPLDEKNIYNQLLLGGLSFAERSVNTTQPNVWLGIVNPSYQFQDDNRLAQYMMWENKDYPSFWKWGAQSDLSMGGGWRVDFHVGGTVKARTACEIYDYTTTYTDPSLHTEYRDSYHPGLHTKYGELNISSSFDFDCFAFPERCPDGFSLLFWYFIEQSGENGDIFSTGDCSFKQLVLSPGLCVFYQASNQTVSVVHVTKEEAKHLVFAVNTLVWMHLLIHFDRNETIIVYVDGQYQGTLLPYSGVVDIKNVIQDNLNFHDNVESVVTRNFSFIPAAPDHSLLTDIRAHPYQDPQDEVMKWMSFQSWSLKPNIWTSPGVDGNGLTLPYKSFVYEFDEYHINATCIHTQECWQNGKTFAMWIKVSSSMKESVGIFSSSSNLTNSAGLDVYYDQPSQKLVVSFNGLDIYSAMFNITFHAWTHIAMVIEQPTKVSLYVNGSLLMDMTSSGPTMDVTAVNVPRYLGLVMCPPGWTKFGSSCYKHLDELWKFWDLQHTCEEYGGNLVNVDNETELNFITKFLYNTVTPVYLGVYDFKMDEPGRDWMNTEGKRQTYQFWDKTAGIPASHSFLAVTCDPDCGTVMRVPYVEDTVNFTGHGGLCEISQKSMAFRREDKIRCPSGWMFWEDNCYLFSNASLFTGLAAHTHCASHRAIVVEIDSEEEQRFISNALYSVIPLPKKAHIGPKFRTVLDHGVAEFTHGDFKPLSYDNWAVLPADTYNPVGCALIDCGVLTCPWVDISCSESWPVICEKPARKYCSHGWDEFGNTCTSIQDTTLTPYQCPLGSALATFTSLSEVLEFASMFDLVGRTCLTDGIVTIEGYVWSSTGEATYFTSETLSGTGNCVGITSTGLQNVNCAVHQCAVCQHGQTGGVSIDNVYFMEGAMDANSIGDLYNKERPTTETYSFTMSSYNSSSNTIQGFKSDGTILYLDSADNITTHNDLVLGQVLSIANDSTGLIYNVTDDDSCLQSFDHCKHSFGASFWLYATNVTECMVLDTVTDGTTGVKIGVTDGNGTTVTIAIKELNYITKTDVPVLLQKEWTHINIVWQKYVGLKIFINFNLMRTVPPSERSPVFPATAESTNTSHVLIGNCSLEMDSYILIKDLEFGTNLLEDYENKQKEDILRIIDFDEPKEKSKTNVHVIIDESIVETYWRNSLFLTAAKIDNPTGLVPAITVPEQTLMCFTSNDVCKDAYTLSLWLYPRDILQSQTFLYTGTRSHSEGVIDSTKIWYDTTVDKYYLSIEYDRTRVTFEFYIYLLEWSHIVLSADFITPEFNMYLNSAKVITKTTSFVQSRVLPVYPNSFMRIGDKGTFDVDDLKFLPYATEPSRMYVLKSCAEYMLAGLTGIKNETVDPDILDAIDNHTVQECNLDLEYSGFYFSMELNETNPETNSIGLNATISFIGDGNYSNLPVIHDNGILLNDTALYISGNEKIKCFYDVRYCFFGFTFSAWVKVIDVSPTTGVITLFEMGGNVHDNQNGASISCVNMTDPTTVNCTAIFINGTDKWTLDFTIMKKQLLHLSFTWNPHLTLKVALNGHSTADFGQYPEWSKIPEAVVPVDSRPIYIGASAFDEVLTCGKMIIDEMTVVDNYLEDVEIKKLFGTKHECPEEWTYIAVSDRCYYVSPTQNSYTGGTTDCQNLDGYLARVPDMETRLALSDLLWSEFQSNAAAWVDLTQLPRGDILFPIRQPNAREPDFPDMASIAFVSTDSMPRCVMILGDGTWIDQSCTGINNVLCEKEPMYVKESPFYINVSNIDDEEFIKQGDISSRRGLTNESLIFNNSYITFVHADDCISNFDYCHNGLSIRFWLMTLDNLDIDEKQVIYTNMMSQNSSGLAVYIIRDSTHHLLGINIRNRASFTSQTVSVSSFVWTHVIVSVSSDSQTNIYLNGELATPITLNIDPNDVMIREFGVSADITFGSGWNGSNQALFMVDNLMYTESYTLMLLPLKQEVYSVFPRFTLPFDNVNKRSPFGDGSTSDKLAGYIGNAIYSDSVSPTAVNFIGQFAYDCFGSQTTCLEGFTMFVWIMTPGYINSYNILSNINQNTGIKIDFRSLHFSLADKFWLTIRDGTATEKQYPFDLVPKTWSQVSVTWFINGTTLFNLNGVTMTEVHLNTVTPVADPVTLLQFDDTVAQTGLPVGTKGGIDELLVIRSPVSENDLLQYYENNTYLHHKFQFTFDNLTGHAASMIEGIKNQSARLMSGVDKINLTTDLGTDICFSNIDLCVHGFTMKFALRFVQEIDLDQVIMTTGGDNPDGIGFALTFTAMNKSLPFRRYFQVEVRTTSHEYLTWFNIQYGVWSDITITFHQRFGIRVFVDDVFAVCENSIMQTRLSPPIVTTQEFIIGSPFIESNVRGIFDVDELNILDRAVHDENLIESGVNIMKHQVHTSPEGGIIHEHMEVSRDECHHYCVDSQCEGYTHCHHEYFGSCFLYTNVTNNTVIDESCDLFMPVTLDSIPAQSAGCLFNTSVSHEAMIEHTETCSIYCKNMSYAFFYEVHGTCYCLTPDPDIVDIFDAENLTISQTCIGSQPIQQATGLREFIQPSSITFLNVTSTVEGIYIMKNESITLDFLVNDGTYAGYRINPADGRDVYYTKYNSTTLIYQTDGLYTIEIIAMNEISSVVVFVNVTVFERIEAVFINHTDVVATDSDELYMLTVVQGNLITCEVYFGDGCNDTMYKLNSSMLFEFTHIYTYEEHFQINVSCNNMLSSASVQSSVIAIDPIVNLTMETPVSVIYGGNITVDLSMIKGSNVSMVIKLNGETILSPFYHQPNGTVTLNIMMMTYNWTGVKEINITAWNPVSGPFELSNIVFVDVVKTNIVLHYTVFARVNESVLFDLSIGNGSNVNIFMNYGDGSVNETYFIDDDVGLSNLKHKIYHTFTEPGVYLIQCELDNSVSNTTLTETIYIEIPVDHVLFTARDVENPVDLVNLTFTVPHELQVPTNALLNISYGNGETINEFQVDFIDTSMTVFHNYTFNGIYTVYAVMWNNVSSINFTQVLVVGRPIMNLTAISNTYYAAIDEVITLSMEIIAGSQMAYILDYGDSTSDSTDYIYTAPNTAFNTTKSFRQAGNYDVQVVANSSFGSVMSILTIHVQEKIEGVVVLNRHVGKMNFPFRFTIEMNMAGTNSCFNFELGNITELVGGYHCLGKPGFEGMNYTYAAGNPMVFWIEFDVPGQYDLIMNASNEVSYEIFINKFTILEFPCSYPDVMIYGLSRNPSKPTELFASDNIIVRAISDTYCDPLQTVLFDWNIAPQDPGMDPAPLSATTLPYLILPENTLDYGTFQINVTVLIENYEEFNDTAIVYIRITQTPLVVLIKGDDKRSVRSETPLKLDASWSYDPDFPLTGVKYNLTWYCWFRTDSSPFNISGANISQVGTSSCFPTLDPVNINYTVVTIPSSLINESVYYFVAMMSSGNRLSAKAQEIHILTPDVQELILKCMENCIDVVSPTAPVRFKGLCETCTSNTRLGIPYKWRLFHAGTEILDFSTWTDTGVDGANLMIKPGYLGQGQPYQLRLESGSAFTVKLLHVVYPPYSGTCSSQITVGKAFNSKFIFRCIDWKDESRRRTRDLTTDSLFLYSYTFTFSYQVVDHVEQPKIPVFQVKAPMGKTPGLVLPPGKADFNYKVNIIIDIVDQEEAETNVILEVQVNPFDESSGHAVLQGFESNVCVRERDMSCILTFCDGLSEFNDSHPDDYQLKDDLTTMLFDNKDLIQDGLHVKQTTAILSRLADSTEDLQSDSQDKMRDLFSGLVSSAETGLSNFLSLEEKENMAASLLTSITMFCQKTKYDQTCDTNCDKKLQKGNNAIEMINLVHNLTGLLLLGNVAGESSKVISVPVGNVKFQAQRKEALDLVNMTMDFTGLKTIKTRSLPDMITQLEFVDVEIMTSDNLYTVDKSVTSVKSRVTVFELLKFEGKRIDVENLPAEIDIYHYPEGLLDLNFTYVNLSATTESPMFFIEIRINETNVIPVIILRPDDLTANITYYVRKGIIPSQTSYDMMGHVQENAVYEASSDCYIIEMDLNGLWTGSDSLPTNVYIGFEANYNITEISPMADVAMYVLGCFYWAEQNKTWSQHGLMLGPVRNSTSALCKTSHLSAFGMNMFVPPNTIDFSTVFSKFSTDNLAVLITVGLVLIAYLILLIPVVRADRRDFKKWAIYPLADNVKSDVYHYQVSVYTGIGQNSGTTSKVYFVLGGEEGDTEVRLLQDEEKRPMVRGSVNNYLLSVPESLGNLMFLRMWLDESEKIDDWLLNMVLIRDVQSDDKYAFLFNKWFAFDKDEGQIDHLIPVATAEEMSAFGHLFFSKTRKDLTDGHLWFSVVSRPMHSTFTRAQRLSCCLSLLFMTMISNCMWYKTDSNQNDGDISQNVHLGPFSFSSQEFFTSLFGSLIVVPLNLLIVTLFRKSKPHIHASSVKVNTIEVKEEKGRGSERKNSIVAFNRELDCATPSGIDAHFTPSPDLENDYHNASDNSVSMSPSSNNLKKKNRSNYPLPHCCLYVAWILVALSVLAAGFFTILYSMEWGSSKSSKWLTSFVLSFVESVLLIQPLKVIMLAILIALVFKTVDADDSVEEVFVIGREKTGTVYPEHRQKFVSDSVDLSRITEAKEHRLKMNRLFDTMRKILIYVVYLSVVAVLAYENKDVNFYPTYSNLQNMLIQPATKNHKNFANLQSTKEFYNWMDETVLPGLYSNGWLNASIEELKPFISDNAFYRLGSPRLRQARIDNINCKTPLQIREYITECYPSYETKTYENRDFTEGWDEVSINETFDEWKYQDTFDLDGLPTVGRYASYSGGGYVAKLGTTIEEASDTLQYLQNTSWIDRRTRGVFVEFNLFNPNVNLFCSVILLLEFPPTGSVFPYWEVRPVVLYRYVGASAIFLFVFDVIFAAYTLYYLIDFIKLIRAKGWRGYFTGFWNVVDFVNIILSIICCAFYGVHFVITKLLLNKFHENRDDFINLQRIVLWDELFGVMLGFILFLSMLKTLKLVRFNAKIAQLYGTITKSSKPLLNYMIVFLISFSAFVSCGYLLFGPHDYEYSSFIRTSETLMSMLMMKVNIDTVLVVSGLLGSLYIFFFVLFVVFVLLNILLSIINEAFADSRKDPSCQSDDPQMVDFLLGQLKRFIWGADRSNQKKRPEDTCIYNRMDKLERKMDRYFIKVIADEKNNVY